MCGEEEHDLAQSGWKTTIPSQTTLAMLRKLIIACITASCAASNVGCASMWPFSSGPNDIRVTSVTNVDFKDQIQLDWTDLKPRPSLPLSRIDFMTNTDLLALARKNDYNITFSFGSCSDGGVKDNGTGLGYVFWNKTHIYSDAEGGPDYDKAVSKGPPFTYQAYVKRIQPGVTPMCLPLSGGNMMGGKVKSNIAVVPIRNN
jgi:hypothetical protein